MGGLIFKLGMSRNFRSGGCYGCPFDGSQGKLLGCDRSFAFAVDDSFYLQLMLQFTHAVSEPLKLAYGGRHRSVMVGVGGRRAGRHT